MSTPLDDLNAAKAKIAAAALADVNKQEGWVKSHLKPLVIGLATGAFVGLIVGHFVL